MADSPSASPAAEDHAKVYRRSLGRSRGLLERATKRPDRLFVATLNGRRLRAEFVIGAFARALCTRHLLSSFSSLLAASLFPSPPCSTHLSPFPSFTHGTQRSLAFPFSIVAILPSRVATRRLPSPVIRSSLRRLFHPLFIPRECSFAIREKRGRYTPLPLLLFSFPFFVATSPPPMIFRRLAV